jgi:peptidoglycan/LPS O-acetylase OafA/YrhL
VNREAPGTGVFWSLAVEEHFYLLFPWLYIAMQEWHMPRADQARLLWGLCALVLVWRCVLALALHATSGRIYIATDTRVDSILFGCALAVWNNPVLDAPTSSPRRWKYVLVPAALLALVFSFSYAGQRFRMTGYFSIQGVALTVLFIAAIRFSAWPPFRFLNSRAVAFIGVLSYSLYLVHEILLSAVSQLLPRWPALLCVLVALAASMIAAWMIYLLVEIPLARLRQRFSHQ